MYAKALALLAVSAFSLSAQAVPQGSPSTTITLPIPTELGASGVVSLPDVVSIVDKNSAAIESLVGTSTFLSLEAELGLLQASVAIGTATAELTAYITQIHSTPIVEVSSKGGHAITIATGTAGALTTFGGQTFKAVPNGAEGITMPKSLLMGAAAVLGSMVMGAVAVL